MHQGYVPRLGGVAVLLAGLGALGLGEVAGLPVIESLAVDQLGLGWLLAGTLVIVTGGIVDDLYDVGPLSKLAFATLAAVLALAGRCGFAAISNPFTGSPVALGPLASVAAVVWIVLIINACNLIDGLDGLAAGVGIIAAAAIFVVSLAQDRVDAACLAVTLGGALLGFLVYNFSPASIFLGDSGSLLLGYLLSILAIQGRGKGPATVVVLVPLLALGLPIVDTVLAVSRRYRLAGSSAVFRADREHIHHRLVTQGIPPHRAVLLLYVVSATFGTLGVLAFFTRGSGSLVVAGVGLIGIYLGLRQLGYRWLPGSAE